MKSLNAVFCLVLALIISSGEAFSFKKPTSRSVSMLCNSINSNLATFNQYAEMQELGRDLDRLSICSGNYSRWFWEPVDSKDELNKIAAISSSVTMSARKLRNLELEQISTLKHALEKEKSERKAEVFALKKSMKAKNADLKKAMEEKVAILKELQSTKQEMNIFYVIASFEVTIVVIWLLKKAAAKPAQFPPLKLSHMKQLICKEDLETRRSRLREWKGLPPFARGLVRLSYDMNCFLNSVFQCLMYCPAFFKILVEKQHSASSSDACKNRAFCLSCALEKLVQGLFWFTSFKPFHADTIIDHLKAIHTDFIKGKQEDAAEFLNQVLWKLSEESGEWISSLFKGEFLMKLRCLTCGYSSVQCEPFHCLKVSLLSGVKNSITQMLQKFTSLELLTGGSQYKCEGCDNAARDAERAFSLFRLPEVLVLQIARFAMNGANTCKLDDHVEFESELDLAPYIDSDLGTGVQMRYKLNGVIVHYGSAPNEGHYAAYVNGSNGMWHFIDDAIVEQVEFSQVQASKAYMLFYSRC